jgi:hypothetical protein
MTRPDGHGGSGRISGVLGERAPHSERRWELGEQLAARKLPAAATFFRLNSAAHAVAPRMLPTQWLSRGAKQARLLGPAERHLSSWPRLTTSSKAI